MLTAWMLVSTSYSTWNIEKHGARRRLLNESELFIYRCACCVFHFDAYNGILHRFTGLFESDNVIMSSMVNPELSRAPSLFGYLGWCCHAALVGARGGDLFSHSGISCKLTAFSEDERNTRIESETMALETCPFAEVSKEAKRNEWSHPPGAPFESRRRIDCKTTRIPIRQSFHRHARHWWLCTQSPIPI